MFATEMCVTLTSTPLHVKRNKGIDTAWIRSVIIHEVDILW